MCKVVAVCDDPDGIEFVLALRISKKLLRLHAHPGGQVVLPLVVFIVHPSKTGTATGS
jgi:hypothetical protein